MKSSILYILGLFTEQFPEHMLDKAPKLLKLMEDNLIHQFKVKPEPQIITGAIKGLTALLTRFSDELLKSPNAVSNLYKYGCLGALDPPAGIKLYHIPKGTSERGDFVLMC